jgi:hypothetical protein
MVKFELPISGGRPSDISSKEITISTYQGNLVRSPYDGVVESVDVNDCGGNVKIKHIVGNDVFHSNLCEVNRITVNRGDNLRKGGSLGIAGDKDLKYSILNSRNQKVRLEPFFNGIDTKTSEKEKDKEKKKEKEKEKNKQSSNTSTFHDSFIKSMLFPFGAVEKLLGSKSKPVSENKALQEELKRIKKLL